MGIERARVVEVHASTPAGRRVAAGYLIGERRVLTAGDVVGPRTAVRPAGTVTWYAASLVWSAASGEAAIVELDEALGAPARMRWGEVSGSRPVPVTAMGFPPPHDRRQPFREA